MYLFPDLKVVYFLYYGYQINEISSRVTNQDVHTEKNLENYFS